MTARVIGMDARPFLSTRTGVERYAAHVADGMLDADRSRELLFFADRPPEGVALPGRVVVVPPKPADRAAPFDLWLARRVGPAARAEGAQVFFSTSSKFPLGSIPSIATIHGMEWWRCPEAYGCGQRLRQNAWMRIALRRAARLVCFASSTVDDIGAFRGQAAERVRIASEAAAPHFRPLDQVPPDPQVGADPFLLVVGTLEPRKNVDGVLRAYGRAVRAVPSLPRLVVAGQAARQSDRLRNVVEAENLVERVDFLGYVSDPRLVALLNRARALLFLSLYEGFGLPILEAMACGTPVVTSDRSSMPEVAGGAALLTDPTEPDAMADAIMRVCTDDALVTDLSRRGRLRANDFSWRRAGSEILDILDEALTDAAA